MKRIVCMLISLALFFSSSAVAFAETDVVVTQVAETESVSRAEETAWYYRVTDDGLLQKRLWSLTYGYWLTDWITIGYL